MTFSPTRTSRRHTRSLAVAGLVAVSGMLVPLACSSDGGTVEADSSTTASTTTTAPSGEATTIPDMGDVVGPVGSCLSAAAKFTNLVQGVLEGGEGATRSQEAAEQLKAELPPDLQDDADLIAEKFGEIAARGGSLTEADVNDPAYSAATTAIGEYFSRDCTG